jgi:hypothetical protein
MAALKSLDQHDFQRQMLGIEGADPLQGSDHGWGNALRFAVVRTAVDYAMPDCRQFITVKARIEPIHDQSGRLLVVRRCHRARNIVFAARTFGDQRASRQADAFDLAFHLSTQRAAGLEQRELDARRTPV